MFKMSFNIPIMIKKKAKVTSSGLFIYPHTCTNTPKLAYIPHCIIFIHRHLLTVQEAITWSRWVIQLKFSRHFSQSRSRPYSFKYCLQRLSNFPQNTHRTHKDKPLSSCRSRLANDNAGLTK